MDLIWKLRLKIEAKGLIEGKSMLGELEGPLKRREFYDKKTLNRVASPKYHAKNGTRE